jgi:hypothetical protein
MPGGCEPTGNRSTSVFKDYHLEFVLFLFILTTVYSIESAPWGEYRNCIYIEIIGKKPPLRKPVISQITPNYGYVDGITTLVKVQISSLLVVKSSKS